MIGRRALFVASPYDLRGHGGVQLCTAEYIAVLEAAGFALDIIAVEQDRRIAARLLRRFGQSSYFRTMSPSGKRDLRERSGEVRLIFANQMNLAGAIGAMNLPDTTVIGLSHGCEITDLLHLHRLHRTLPLTSTQLRPWPLRALAATLRDEVAARSGLDGVIAISPFDAEMEKWLGTRHVCWVPRTITPAPLRRNPVSGRFGYVGTLDHAPNLEGLVAILDEIGYQSRDGLCLRVVGGPERLGRWLADHYKTVDYLGPLSNEALEAEAGSWNGFVHPIFCLPRGCSTKLAMALAWGLPVITTAEGRRGYEWRDGALTEAATPSQFVAQMCRLTNTEADAAAVREVGLAATTSPDVAYVAARVHEFFATLSPSRSHATSTNTAAGAALLQ